MRLFALADLHLSFGSDKSMEIFHGWEHYTSRIETNWRRVVAPEDTVVLAGDISWGMSLDEAREDFAFLEALPGKKIIVKGNHDYWWTTVTKMTEFFRENRFDSLHILHNNCFTAGRYALCGTRGWLYDGSGERDERIIARECGRLEASLAAGEQSGLEPMVFLHYPPVYGDFICEEIMEVLRRHSVKRLCYGHIHGSGKYQAVTGCESLQMRLISCDSVDFTPVFLA